MDEQIEYPKESYTHWDDSHQVLVTRLSGLVTLEEVEEWKEQFYQTANQIPRETTFKLFSNIHGFKAVNMDAHKSFREVIPAFLAEHGLKPGYAKLFPEVPVQVSVQHGKVVTACAHVHHDETKITRYHQELATANEDFFTDPELAEQWLYKL